MQVKYDVYNVGTIEDKGQEFESGVSACVG